MVNCNVTSSNSTFLKNDKAVVIAVKEVSPTNRSILWTENEEAFLTAYEEYKKFAVNGIVGYTSSSYYIIECNGYFYLGGQGTQFMNGNPQITVEDGKVTQVKILYYTYKTVGEEDLSVNIGEEDNLSVKIYTLK